jgi:Mg2+/Co2+ transporter CorC
MPIQPFRQKNPNMPLAVPNMEVFRDGGVVTLENVLGQIIGPVEDEIDTMECVTSEK